MPGRQEKLWGKDTNESGKAHLRKREREETEQKK